MGTPEQRRSSEEVDRALVSRALREREEVATRRARSEHNRARIVFVFELVLAVVVCLLAVGVLWREPELMPLFLLGGGGLGGVATLLRRRPEG